MEKLKNNIVVKYTVGSTIITLIVLIIQTVVFNSYDAIGESLAKIIFTLVAIIIPVVGLYIVTKKTCKGNFDIRQGEILTKIFIISVILSLFAVVYLGNILHIFGNIEDKMLVFAKGDVGIIESTTLKQYEQYVMNYLKINNAKFVLKALLISTLYIFILIVVFVRHWINKHTTIEKKQVIYLIFAFIVVIMIQILLNVTFCIKEGNIQIPITTELESKTTYIDKQKIENKLDNMKEISNYEYKSAEDELDNFKDFLSQYGSSLSNNYNSKYFNERYIINIHYKDKEEVMKQLEALDGIKSIKAGL